MQAIHVKTPGLMCDACTGKVRSALKDLPGVISVNAEFSRGITSVLFDESMLEPPTVIDAIVGAGFEVQAD